MIHTTSTSCQDAQIVILVIDPTFYLLESEHLRTMVVRTVCTKFKLNVNADILRLKIDPGSELKGLEIGEKSITKVQITKFRTQNMYSVCTQFKCAFALIRL